MVDHIFIEGRVGICVRHAFFGTSFAWRKRTIRTNLHDEAHPLFTFSSNTFRLQYIARPIYKHETNRISAPHSPIIHRATPLLEPPRFGKGFPSRKHPSYSGSDLAVGCCDTGLPDRTQRRPARPVLGNGLRLSRSLEQALQTFGNV